MPATAYSGSGRSPFYSDLSIGLAILLLFALFRGHSDWVLLISWVLIFGYLILLRRFAALMHLLLATILAAIWVHFAKDYYAYKIAYIQIFELNSLPLMAWTLSLFELGEYCSYLKFKPKSLNFLFFVLVVWTTGIFLETFAYHVLEIRDTMTASYPGLPFCDCVHAPTWMKVAYALMAPSYYLVKILADSGITLILKKNDGGNVVPVNDVVKN